ncbi:hypothetical protein N7517_005095 [Penicillium concentricum]|uniref:F-box domain-containing protein n=1 Tax=Penicillium concentricum TaxID=293559 RepID=A0A9W9VA07_9EURO|nr:uncharacterized protein N7517_005095 [Penicillium concentricum]KAJ5373089.1 hypothetical protein N7517_005095 [Penicillium concentricum]
MGLLDLPVKLILMIEEHLPTQADVSALMRCHSSMLAILQKRLYSRAKSFELDSNLRWACERGNEGLASAMLIMGADILLSVNDPVPLSIVAIHGHLNMVKSLLKHDPTIINNTPYPTDDKCTAIVGATIQRHTDIVKFLLAQPDLDPQKPSSYFIYKTTHKLGEYDTFHIPINQALYDGNHELVRILLEDTRVELSPFSLIAAARGGHEDMVRLCLLQFSQRFDPNEESLLIIATRDNNMGLVKLLLEVASHSSEMEWETDGKASFIVSAANQEPPNPDKSLLARNNISVEATDYDGRSPFTYAASYGNVEMMKILLDTRKFDVDLPDECGRTPLSHAASVEKEPVKFLLPLDDVNPGSKDHNGLTPFHHAAMCGEVQVMAALLDTGKVDINYPDMHGQTPYDIFTGC